MNRFPLVLVLSCLVPVLFPVGAFPVAAGEVSPVPFSPLFGELSPELSVLLEPAEVPPEAVSVEEPPVLARPDARVLAFGERIPVVRCLPYRVCSVLLEPGEVVLHLALGDSERWLVEEVSAPGAAPVLVLKPLAFNLLTNLVARTDRRLYVIELVSPHVGNQGPAGGGLEEGAAYDALVRFSYPGAWSRRVAEAPAVPAAAGVAPGGGPAEGPGGLCFDYEVERPWWPGSRLRWTPWVVYDDGERTFLRLPPEARHRDLPAVLVVGGGGEPLPTDTTLGGPRGEWLVVPTVAGRLRLVVGSEGQARRLTLVRRGALCGAGG